MKPSIAKDKILTIFFKNMVFDGFSEKSLKSASKEAGFDEDYYLIVFPEGLIDVIKYYNLTKISEIEKEISNIKKTEDSTTKYVKQLVILSLNQFDQDKTALKTLIRTYIFPDIMMNINSSIWNISNLIWRQAGDNSTDLNYYSKRMLLACVYKSTLLYWLQSESKTNSSEVEEFLDQALEKVALIGKAKSQFRDLTKLENIPLFGNLFKI